MRAYYRNVFVQLTSDRIQQQPTRTRLVTNACSAQQRSELLFYDKLRWFPYCKLWEGLLLFLSEARSHLFLDSVCIAFMMTLAGYVRKLVIILFLNIVQLSRIRAYHTHEETLSLFPFQLC